MWQDEIALVYEAAAKVGINPLVADECEMWVLAAALGANRADEPDDPLADEQGLPWAVRRARAAALGEPMPTWDEVPLTPKEIADQKRLMGAVPAMMPPGMAPPL